MTASGGAVAAWTVRGVRAAAVAAVVTGIALALSGCGPPAPGPDRHPTPVVRGHGTASAKPSPTPTAATRAPQAGGVVSPYPWHTGIVATTFWVGEIFDPNAADGSQVISTYDSDWLGSYGGCDGVVAGGACRTQARTAANGFFPTAMAPRQNPFYLDLPYDDVNDSIGFAERDRVIPWAGRFVSSHGDQSVSYLKNQWVELRKGGRVCFGQIEDAGPGEYHDAAYVFGAHDARPANRRYNGAGMDVSPALNGCLAFAELDGDGDRVDWRFVDASQVPAGPWTRIVTTSGVR